MRIGIVTTWFERGAAYVSRNYMESLQKEGHDVFIYARGGEIFAKGDSKWDLPNVTWDVKNCSDYITEDIFINWIKEKSIEILFFNEQRNFSIIATIKTNYPYIKIGAYVDYYTEKMLKAFNMIDFVICNTKRHFEAMDNHPQRYYLKWGTDTNLFRLNNKKVNKKEIVFFHSVGMAPRKGTDILLDAYIEAKLYDKSKLIIHTQIPIESVSKYSKKDLEKYRNIEIIEKTVTAPGLYHLGDVYVYPTRVDGLGLTMYEALACGLPVITTDCPPMSEIIDDEVGKLVDVERFYCREDGYYWPMAKCSKVSLINAMNFYIENPNIILKQKTNARKKAEEFYEWSNKSKDVSNIFVESKLRKIDEDLINQYLPKKKKNYLYRLFAHIKNRI